MNGIPTTQWLGGSSYVMVDAMVDAMVEEPRRSEMFWPKRGAVPLSWLASIVAFFRHIFPHYGTS